MPTTAFSSPTSQQQGQPHRYGAGDPFSAGAGNRGTPRAQLDDWRDVQPIPGSSGNQRYFPSPESSPNQSVSGTDIGNPIDFACQMTEDLMAKDLNFPSLFKTLFGSEEIGYNAVSGLVEHDYPNVIERGLMPNKLWITEHQTPLPADLKNLASQADAGSVRMGLFPEIFRAWMTIDSDFYLWDFRDGSDLSYYDTLRESIVGIALVPVKKNVFKSSIRHLLCVTTASEIFLLGFILVEGSGIRGGPASPSRTSMEIVSHPIFTLQTEAINFPVIAATPSGRIFLGGQDGSLHEIWYQAGRGWLRDRCGKTNLTRSYFSLLWPKFLKLATPDPILDIVADKHRNILFTLSASGLIQVYDLGKDGSQSQSNQFTNVGCMSFDVLVISVVSLGKNTLDANCVKRIISIAPIEYGEMNLVAVADSGVRLYFSCFERPHVVPVTESSRPTVFKLVHIRLPPGFSPLASTKRPDNAHQGFCARGIFTLACTSARDKDLLWLMTPFPYPSIKYAELANVHVLPGVLHDMREVSMSEPNAVRLDYPDIITQHLSWQRQIVVLTSWGTSVFRVQKPFELLRDLLIQKKGPENIKQHFYMLPTREHPLTNVLLIAIHPFLYSDNNLQDYATKSLFLYGDTMHPTDHGVPASRSQQRTTFDNQRFDSNFAFEPNVNSTPEQEQLEFTGFGSPTMHSTLRDVNSPNFTSSANTSTAFPGSPSSPSNLPQTQSTEFSYTPRHNALYLMVGRILLPFWHRKIVTTNIVRNVATRPTKMVIPNISGEEVAHAVSFLTSVHKFLDNNPSLYISNIKGKYSSSPGGRLLHYDPEKLSLSHLKAFLGLILEVLGMWQILCDHQFHVVLEGVDEALYNSTMKELVVGGHSVVAIIINSLIHKYLGDSTAVDAISLRLREVCPTLFRNEDAIWSKVSEILTRAKNTNDPLERELLLKSCLQLSEQVCGQTRFDIKGFCHQFAALGFPIGAVKLCVSAARGVDPHKLALEAFKTQSETTEAVLNAYRQRIECYKIVFEILDSYLIQSSIKQSPLTTRKSGDNISPERAKQVVDETIKAILHEEDEAFHITLYNWLMDRRLFDRLLEIKHDYLDSFLKRAADSVVSGKWAADDSGRNDTRILDLLWRHHEMNGNHQAAAHILSKLADTTTTGLNLQQRLEYLSRAVICGKSMGRQGDVLEIYEDKLEVAQIQKLILDSIQIRLGAVSVDPSIVEAGAMEAKLLQDAIVKLNGQLFNITELFAKFAHPFKLYEAHLEIYHSAGHAEPRLIDQVWADIINSELSLARGQPKETQMQILKQKIVAMGRKYLGAPTYFPIEKLIDNLESIKSPEIDVGWVFNMMLEIGVSFFELLHHYERLWKKVMLNRERAPGADFQLARVILLMISTFVRGEIDFHGRIVQKNELVEKCTDLIAALIVEFSSRFDPAAVELTQQLNASKERLDNYR